MGKMKLIETEEYPICPYCEKEMQTLLKNTQFTFMMTHTIYSCPHCKKLLSVGKD